MGLWALLPWCAVLAVYLTPPADLKRLALAVALVTAIATPIAHALSYVPEALESIQLFLWLGLLLGLTQLSARVFAISPTLLLSNGWVMAVSLTGLRSSLAFGPTLAVASLSAAGFYLFTCALQALYLSVDQTRLAPSLQGTPILLISAAIMGLALFGLASFGIL